MNWWHAFVANKHVTLLGTHAGSDMLVSAQLYVLVCLHHLQVIFFQRKLHSLSESLS
jgi:hypothetical protein